MKVDFSTLKALITLLLCASLFSCENNPLAIDVSDVKIDLQVQRFEQDLYETNPIMTPEEVKSLHNKYGIFFQDFTEHIINMG